MVYPLGLFEEEQVLNEALIHSPENVWKRQLSNIPWWNVDHRYDHPLFYNVHLLKVRWKLLYTTSCGLLC